jgi:hypothetical protein
MYYAADKEIAHRALADLRMTRLEERAATLAALQRLRTEVACERTNDIPRLQAWMSIHRLYDAVKAGDEGDLKPLWQEAIARTAAWRASLR